MRCIVIPDHYFSWSAGETPNGYATSNSSSNNNITTHTTPTTVYADPSPISAPASPISSFSSPCPPRTAKLEEDFLVLPAEDEKLLQNFEILLQEIQKSEAAAASFLAQTPPESPGCSEDDDVATSLLQSLIHGGSETDNSNQSDCFTSDDIADFDLAFIEDTARSSALKTSHRKQRSVKKDPYLTGEDSPDPSLQRRGPRRKLPPEDRKLRKKEQNKTAATRYRMKKKAEIEELTTQENQLAERKAQLQQEHNELATELRYLKKLMREAGILE